ncbi:MAG: alkaline phosphatase family protein, partial [Candidatus Lutacidiplasmatales archaeon]
MTEIVPGTADLRRPVGGSGPESPGGTPAIAVAFVLVLVVATVGPLLYFGGGPAPSTEPIPISHIVVVDMEYHAYDNLFGGYCTTVGPNCPTGANGVPAGTCVPRDPSNASMGCVVPYNYPASELSSLDPRHEWNATVASIDGGRMDGFYLAEQKGDLPFGHYNGSTIPVYWDMAQQFGLGDNFFSSALSYSLPNHWYLLAGAAPPQSVNTSVLTNGGFAAKHAYLNASNRTSTVQDLLNRSPSTTWKYYDWALPSYQTAINEPVITGMPGAYSYWNPLAARYESYTQWYVNHFASRSSFFNDTASGQLPAVSWVIPDPSFSDHPPSNLTKGESFVASVVDAIESTPAWRSTAIFVTWDDYG